MSNWSFVEHLTQHMARPRPGDSKHPTQWPSEASAVITVNGEKRVVGKCKRDAFFRLLEDSYKFYPRYSHWKPLVERLQRETIPVEPYMRWIWAQGELYEEYLVEQAKNSGVFINGQTPIYVKDLNLSGKIDVEVINPQTGKLSIVEAKSVYGFGGNMTLGSPADRKKGQLGKPRDSNLMQIALYDWWRASKDTAYEESRLNYGDRGTGRYAEYLVKTFSKDGVIHIKYKGIAPIETAWTISPITIDSILESYRYVQQCIDSGVIPPRDFDQQWNEERLESARANGELTKTETTQYDKVKARKEYNDWVNAASSTDDAELLETAWLWATEIPKAAQDIIHGHKHGDDLHEAAMKLRKKLKPKAELKQVVKGDYQCGYCSRKTICYKPDGTPREI